MPIHYPKKKKKSIAKSATKAPKTAAKGTFDLQQRVFLPPLCCHYRSITAVTKSATVDTPFSNGFGLLQWAKNRRHMTFKFMSIDFQQRVMYAAIGVHLQQWVETPLYVHTFQQQVYPPLYVHAFSSMSTHCYMFEPIMAGDKRRNRFFFFPQWALKPLFTSNILFRPVTKNL